MHFDSLHSGVFQPTTPIVLCLLPAYIHVLVHMYVKYKTVNLKMFVYIDFRRNVPVPR